MGGFRECENMKISMGVRNMVRKLLLFVCISLFFVSVNIFSSSSYVKPILSYQEGEITGKAYSMIINSKDKVFFFNNKGECFKILEIDSKLTKCKISMNHDYICLATQNGLQTTEVMLLDESAQIMWKKVVPYLVNIAGISINGKNVLLKYETKEGSCAIAYLDEKGKEIKVLGNKYIQSVSKNSEYWICKDRPYREVEKLYFFNRGELIREFYINEVIYESVIGNNGNFLLKTDKNSHLFYKENSNFVNIKYKDYEVFLANNGQIVFHDYGSYVDFFDLDQSNTIRKIFQREIDRITGGSILTFCKLSQTGAIALYEVSRQKDAISYLYIFKNGNITYSSLELLEGSNSNYSKEFILQDNYLLLKNMECNDFFLFKI